MKKMKRLLCVALVLAMVLSLCSCKDGEEEVSPEVQAQAAANTAEAKKYVYSGKDIDLGVDFNNVGMYGMTCVDGRVYVLIEDWNNELGGGEGSSDAVADDAIEPRVNVGVDGDMVIEDGVIEVYPMTPEEEYVYIGPSYYLISVKIDGTDRQMYKLDIPSTGSYSYISANYLAKDGSVIVLVESAYEDYSDPENPIYEPSFMMYKWDNQGVKQWELDMTPDTEEGAYAWFYVNNFMENNDGTLSLITGEQEVVILSAQGEIVDRYKMNESGTENIGQIFKTKDGTVYATSYDNDWIKMYISTYDLKTGKLGEKKEMPEGLSSFSMYPGSTTDLLLSNSMGIYTYNIGDAEPVKVMDFINSDVPTYGMSNITFLDDKTFVANYYDSTDYENHIAVFTYVDPSTIADKAIITLGCQWLGGDIKSRVIEFNKTNPKYRISVKAYGETGDYEQAITNMNNDIISGKMPDIIMIEPNQDISSWVNKGLLADIRALIAEDSELANQEYLQNIWDAFAIDGTLYTLVPDFSVETFAVKKSLAGNRTGWTMSEFQQFMKGMGPDVSPFGSDMLRDSFLYYMMNYCGGDFVDINTGTCNFMSDEFIAMLEYAKTLPVEFSEDYWEDYDWTMYESQYRDNKAVMLNIYMYRIADLVYNIHGTLGEEAVFIGFPGLEGNTSVIRPGSYMYGISAKSLNTEGAWEFLRYYLTEEYQNSEEMYSLPVLKSAFESKAMESTKKPYWINENGEKEEYDNYYYINGESIVLEQFTKQEVDAICNFVYSLNKRGYYNQDIINIVNEEAALFFDGQKNARDVAAVIQSRVQLYVDENQ